MFANKTYALDKNAETVPIVTEATALSDLATNPRATNENMWAFILSDLDKAEQYLADYQRPDKLTPDKSVVYGLKARAYLVMEDWENAEKYAKLAQAGYQLMSEADYTDSDTGFNTPNSSWMFGLKVNKTLSAEICFRDSLIQVTIDQKLVTIAGSIATSRPVHFKTHKRPP